MRDPAVAQSVRRHAHLIVACHVKDLAAAGLCVDEDGWADLGEGRMPWGTLCTAARSAGAGLMVLEHDAPRDPERFLRNSVAAARRLQRMTLPSQSESQDGKR